MTQCQLSGLWDEYFHFAIHQSNTKLDSVYTVQPLGTDLMITTVKIELVTTMTTQTKQWPL